MSHKFHVFTFCQTSKTSRILASGYWCGYSCIEYIFMLISRSSLIRVLQKSSFQIRSFAMSSSFSNQDNLKIFRQLLHESCFDAYIVTSADSHQSEYVAECDKRRAFISSFNGSAGTTVITNKNALLWTDGRYFLQVNCLDYLKLNLARLSYFN